MREVMSGKPRIIAFGAGVVFEKFLDSGDADAYDICAVWDNLKSGLFRDHEVNRPVTADKMDFDLVILTLWDKPEVIDQVTQQLLELGFTIDQIKVYSYDRHCLCDVSDKHQVTNSVDAESLLYAYYDLNRSSETYDVTSFLAVADCYREQQNLDAMHVVIVCRDERWEAQAYCLEQHERNWRAENILKQACALLPTCKGVTFCSSREQASMYLNIYPHKFPADYRLINPPPITVHKDFYYWLDQGFDPRRFNASPKALDFVSTWIREQLPARFSRVISVTMRESTLQPKRNSDPVQWNGFFQWLSDSHPDIAVVVIRDTEKAFFDNPFVGSNVYLFREAAFHMDLRMAMYELAYLNMGCSNGPKQLCHLSKTASYITTKMIVDDYQGSSRARFIERKIDIGKNFRFAGDNQIIDWRDDSTENLIDSFIRFTSIRPAS